MTSGRVRTVHGRAGPTGIRPHRILWILLLVAAGATACAEPGVERDGGDTTGGTPAEADDPPAGDEPNSEADSAEREPASASRPSLVGIYVRESTAYTAPRLDLRTDGTAVGDTGPTSNAHSFAWRQEGHEVVFMMVCPMACGNAGPGDEYEHRGPIVFDYQGPEGPTIAIRITQSSASPDGIHERLYVRTPCEAADYDCAQQFHNALRGR